MTQLEIIVTTKYLISLDLSEVVNFIEYGVNNALTIYIIHNIPAVQWIEIFSKLLSIHVWEVCMNT